MPLNLGTALETPGGQFLCALKTGDILQDDPKPELGFAMPGKGLKYDPDTAKIKLREEAMKVAKNEESRLKLLGRKW